MQDSGKISLIIPCFWANEELLQMTLNCLNSLANTEEAIDEVIIIDDGSPIQAEFDDEMYNKTFITLRKEKNGGYASAVNMGLFHAQGDILILGNNDLTFPTRWVTELLRPLRLGYDIATCWTSDQDDIEIEDYIEDNAKFGSLLAMRRDVYDLVGPFDEQFKGYFSDTDYRRRVLNEGLTIGKNHKLCVDHLAKATYKHTDPDDKEFIRSARLYEIKHGEQE